MGVLLSARYPCPPRARGRCGGSKRESERARESEREKERQTHRQIDRQRQTDTASVRETKREKQRARESEREREGEPIQRVLGTHPSQQSRAHAGQSRPDCGLELQEKVLNMFQAFPASLGSG